MDRRRFVIISASAGAAVAAVAAGCSGRLGGPISELEPLLTGRAPNRVYRTRVQYADTVIDGKTFHTRTYDGRIPGPTVVTSPGEILDFEIINALPPNPKAPCPTGPMMIPEIRDEMEDQNPTPKRYRRASGPWDCMNNPHEFNTTNLHTHGIQTIPHLFEPVGTSNPAAPMLGIEPGSRFRYQLPVPSNHPSGLHWYHPHHHGATDVQVSGGMAGLIVVRGPIDRVPEIAAAREYFVVIQSLQVNPASRPNHYDLEYKAYKSPKDGGYFVDTKYTMFTVATDGASGRSNARGVMWEDRTDPEHPVYTHTSAPPSIAMRPGEVIRLRLLNGCNQHTLPLILPNMEVWQIGFDGVNLLAPKEIDMSGNVKGGVLTITNFIEAPVRMTVPGNRIEFLIKAPDTPDVYTLSSMDASDLHGPATKIDLLKIVVSGPKKPMSIPDVLPTPEREYPLLPAPNSIPRKFTFSFKGNSNTILTGFDFLVNGVHYQEMICPTTVKLGAVEEWRIENATGSIHPFHLHVNSFQLVSINDEPVSPNEIWDTFYVPPARSRTDGKNGSINIRIKFQEWIGKTVHHCHFLGHEDTGMMQNFLIQ